jgi:hypothetical protein
MNNFFVRERSVERRAANGNYVAFACGPLIGRQRYINEKIEEELVEFKREIEEKYARSKVNREFKYPRTAKEKRQADIEVLIGDDDTLKIVGQMSSKVDSDN